MVYPKGSGCFMSKSESKKMAAAKKRADKSSEEADEAAKEAAKSPQSKRETPVVIDLRKGGSSHNCPEKNAGRAHLLTKRCLKARHAGVCRECHHLVSAKYGCHMCKTKREQLQYTKVKLAGDEEE